MCKNYFQPGVEQAMQDLIDCLYDMHVSADIKIEELAEDIISIVNSNDNITQ